MTEREPFARSIQLLSGSENKRWGIVIDGIHLPGIEGSKQDAHDRAFLINQYFKKRLSEELEKARKEAEKKAVEELAKWRKAATILGERVGTVGPKGYYSFTADEFLAWMSLPTEPEERK